MAIHIHHLSKSFENKKVLQNFSASFPLGKTTAIMGPSGCGKTTLLMILMGLVPYDEGNITGLEGKHIGAIFQEDRLCENISPLYNLRLTTPKALGQESFVPLLVEAGLEEKDLTLPIRSFSGGMKRRVALVRALLAPGDVLLMDEPFQGLDEETKEEMIAMVKKYTQGKTLLLVTHSLQEAQGLGASILNLSFPA